MNNYKICLVNVKGKFITVKPGINIYDIIITLPIREFKLRVIRQTANVKQRKYLRYQAIKSK
jgi:hypothetical protein